MKEEVEDRKSKGDNSISTKIDSSLLNQWLTSHTNHWRARKSIVGERNRKYTASRAYMDYLKDKALPKFYGGGDLIEEGSSSENLANPITNFNSWYQAIVPSYQILPNYKKVLFNFSDLNNSLVYVNEYPAGAFMLSDEDLNKDENTDSAVSAPEKVSIENIINSNREEHLNALTPELLTLLREEYFEFGVETKSEKLIKEQLDINAITTRNWLTDIFVTNFDSNEPIVTGLLHILGRLEESLIGPQGQTMAMTALHHKSDEIRELAIRAFEKWCSSRSLSVLKGAKFESKWLQQYVDQVIKDLEEQLCLC